MKAVLPVLCPVFRKRRLQTGVFACGCFFAAFFLLGVCILNAALEPSFDRTYKKLDAPDMTVTVRETDAGEEELKAFLHRLLYVEGYRISRRCLADHVKLPERSMDFAFVAASEDREVKSGEVILNNAVYGVGAGDEVEISINGHTVVLNVDSVVTDAVNSAPDARIPYLWMNGEELAGLTEGYEKGDRLMEIWLSDLPAEESGTRRAGQKGVRSAEMAERFAEDYGKYFGRPFDGNLTSYEDIRRTYIFRYGIFSRFLSALAFFLFIMVLMMTMLICRMAVRADRKQIGILKAVGFTGRRLKSIYTGQYLLIAMLTGGCGVMVSGSVFRSWLSGMFANIDRSLFHISGLWCYRLLVFLGVSAVSGMTVWISVRRSVEEPPADAIRCEGDGRRSGRQSGPFQRPGLVLPMPRFLPLNLAAVKCLRRKAESVFIFVLTLGTALLYLISFYIIDGVGEADRHLAEWGIVEADVYISRKENADEKESGLLSALDQDPEVDFYYAGLSDSVAYRLEGSSLPGTVTGEIYDGEIPAGLDYSFMEGRNPGSYREAAIGINFAKEKNLGIGDKIYVIRNGEETELVIVGIYPSFKQYGRSIRFLTEDIREFFGNRADGYYTILLKDGTDVNAFAQKMAAAFTDFNFFPMRNSMTRSVRILRPPMAVCMVLAALIYLLLLLCIKKIMLLECKKDFHIYRFTGFSRRRTAAVVRWRFGIPVLFGAVCAVPLSVSVLPELLKPLARQLGLSELPIYPDALLVAAALAGILLCGLLPVVRTDMGNESGA